MGGFSISGSKGSGNTKIIEYDWNQKLLPSSAGENLATTRARQLSEKVAGAAQAFAQQRTPANYKKLATAQAELKATTANGGRASANFEPRLTTGAQFDTAAIAPQVLQQTNATLKSATSVLKEFEVGRVQTTGPTGFAGQKAKSANQWSTELSVQQAYVAQVNAAGVIEKRAQGYVVTNVTLQNPKFGKVEGQAASAGFSRPIKNLPIAGAKSLDQALSIARTKINSGEWNGERMIMIAGAGKPIDQMNGLDKIIFALQAGAKTAGPAIQQEIMAMFTVEGMAQMAAFAGLSAIPVVGQLMNAGMFVVLLAKLGPQAQQFVGALWDAANAKSFQQLQTAGDQMSGMIKEAVVMGVGMVLDKGAAKGLPKNTKNIIWNTSISGSNALVKAGANAAQKVKTKAPRVANAAEAAGGRVVKVVKAVGNSKPIKVVKKAAAKLPIVKGAIEGVGKDLKELNGNGGIRPLIPKKVLPDPITTARSNLAAARTTGTGNQTVAAVVGANAKGAKAPVKVTVSPDLAYLLDATKIFAVPGVYQLHNSAPFSAKEVLGHTKAHAVSAKASDSAAQRRVNANARSQLDWRSAVKESITELNGLLKNSNAPQPVKVKERVSHLQKKLDVLSKRAERNGWTADAAQVQNAIAKLQGSVAAFIARDGAPMAPLKMIIEEENPIVAVKSVRFDTRQVPNDVAKSVADVSYKNWVAIMTPIIKRNGRYDDAMIRHVRQIAPDKESWELARKALESGGIKVPTDNMLDHTIPYDVATANPEMKKTIYADGSESLVGSEGIRSMLDFALIRRDIGNVEEPNRQIGPANSPQEVFETLAWANKNPREAFKKAYPELSDAQVDKILKSPGERYVAPEAGKIGDSRPFGFGEENGLVRLSDGSIEISLKAYERKRYPDSNSINRKVGTATAPSIVHRGDSRTPEEMIQPGGGYGVGVNASLGMHFFNYKQVPTALVSVASDLYTAVGFATKEFDNVGYIYVIKPKASSKLISKDLVAPGHGANEKEWVAFGFDKDEIVGFRKVTLSGSGDDMKAIVSPVQPMPK